MSKIRRQSLNSPAKLTKHQQEMGILQAHHDRIMNDASLRQSTLIDAGIFVRHADRKLTVAKPYDKVITPKRTP